MARIRTIKPEFWDSPSTAKASPWARLAYIAMWNWADDYGRGTANLKELEGFIFPNDSFPVQWSGNTVHFRDIVAEIAECFDVVFYEVGGRPFYAIESWEAHQRNERRAKASRYPGPPEKSALARGDVESSGNTVHVRSGVAEVPSSSDPGTGEKGNRGTGEQDTSLRSVPAPRKRNATKANRGTRLDENWLPAASVREEMAKERPDVDLRHEHKRFVDYWLSISGQKGVKLDWTRTWRNWMRDARSADGRRGSAENTTLIPWTPEPPPREIQDDPAACDDWYRQQAERRRSA